MGHWQTVQAQIRRRSNGSTYLCQIDSFFHNSLDRSFSNRRSAGLVFIITKFIEIPVFDANRADPDIKGTLANCVDPDQTPEERGV